VTLEKSYMSLEARNLGVTYSSVSGRAVVAIEDMSLEFKNGEFVSIIGPSGCGKSTLLHCLGGLLTPTSGQISVNGVPVTEPDPKLAAFVFQDYTLLPWKTVEDNAAIGLRFAGAARTERRQTAREMLELVGLGDFMQAYPSELSGGMQQRVAIARAMAMDPTIMLMDEPFGALDEQTRRHLGFDMSRILTERERSVVMVTHSLDEAILWADRLIVLSARPGRIAREIIVDEPRPRELKFIGTPRFAEIRSELFGLLEQFAADARDDAAAQQLAARDAS
jgi:NitT/TauT family transport system ATP-binding protein